MTQGDAINQDRIVSKIIGDEAILLDVHTGYCYSFNVSATDIWKALNRNVNIEKIAKGLAEAYQVPEAAAQKDLDRFLKSLMKENILKSMPKGKSHDFQVKQKQKKEYSAPKFIKYHEIKRGRSVA